ncbi:hypothetical protein ACFP1I_06220 [Dyadobacter subterraneus]|uniref:Glycosyl-4,4'-diaponeurosporenoate acyltransferase n=1 Tax=Dyadobacter subterraneus TaxID=2773304 RepID=A0ABR9WFJ1_9BACT|nr:hypothetical protein [Dyadobacter subterraneus]MBE9464276.1 hypothetical protein [Dyadobacter subterraneus]
MKKEFLNQLINFFWTILCFASVFSFWFFAGLSLWFYAFLGVSFLSGLVPSRFFRLSNNPQFYEKLGARWIRKFVQNGDLVNLLTKNQEVSTRSITDKNDVAKYLKTISMYEKYHFICFIFFSLSGIFAVFQQSFFYFILILASNILYNVGPVILQQYNRARIFKLKR